MKFHAIRELLQVAKQTRDMLLDRYDFEYRDHIEVKGVDTGMDTFLLVGRKADRLIPKLVWGKFVQSSVCLRKGIQGLRMNWFFSSFF